MGGNEEIRKAIDWLVEAMKNMQLKDMFKEVIEKIGEPLIKETKTITLHSKIMVLERLCAGGLHLAMYYISVGDYDAFMKTIKALEKLSEELLTLQKELEKEEQRGDANGEAKGGNREN